MQSREAVRQILQQACSRNLWMAVPIELEDYIADFAAKNMRAEDVNDSVCGELFELAATCSL